VVRGGLKGATTGTVLRSRGEGVGKDAFSNWTMFSVGEGLGGGGNFGEEERGGNGKGLDLGGS